MRVSLLCLKRKVLYEFPQKCFKTTERNNFAVYDSLCGEKQFLLILSHLTDLIQNICLNKSKYFSEFFHFKNGKKNKLSEYFIAVSERATFLTKKRNSLWISPKILQNNRKIYFSSMWLTLWRKPVFFNI